MAYRDMRGALGISVAVCAIAVSGPAWAQSKQFDVPTQSAATGIPELARQADIQILVSERAVRGKTTKAVRGAMTVEQALRRLIAGTGLRIISSDGRTFTLAASDGADAATRSDTASSYEDDSGEIIVTAQKRDQRLQDVPISVTVLSGRTLDRSTSEGVRDALTAVPSVAVFTDYLGSGTNTTIRGVSAAFPHFAGSSPVAYYLDSVPFGLVTSAFSPDSNAYDLDRVEVLRGPQGTLYGSSALNGVVRVLTQEADLNNYEVKARGLVSGTYRGGANYRADGAINVPLIEGKLALRGVIGYQNNSGWIDQPNNKDANENETQTYRFKLNAQPTDRLSIGAFTWISRYDAGAPSFGYTNYKMSSVLDQAVKTDYDAYGLNIAYDFPGFTVSSATSYLNYYNIGHLGLDVPGFGASDTDYISFVESDIFSQEVNIHSSTDGNWRWSIGGIYRKGRDKSGLIFTGVLAAIPFPSGTNTSESYAFYGELTRLFFDRRLELTIGARHFHDTETATSRDSSVQFPPGRSVAKANTPRAVLTWHATDRHMLYASYGQGFRSGYPNNGSLLALYPDFPPLRPDRLYNYEIGAKGDFWNNRLGYDFAVYYTKWKDIQQQLTLPHPESPAGVNALYNSGTASGKGFDLSIFAKPIDGLTLNASFSWNDLSFDSDVLSAGEVLFAKGARPSGSPSTTASGSAEYQFPLGESGYKGTFSASVSYTSKITYRGIFAGAAALTDLGASDEMTVAKASFTIDAPQNWSATLFVDNINNWDGIAARTFVGIDDWNARVRPRTIGLQVAYRY